MILTIYLIKSVTIFSTSESDLIGIGLPSLSITNFPAKFQAISPNRPFSFKNLYVGRVLAPLTSAFVKTVAFGTPFNAQKEATSASEPGSCPPNLQNSNILDEVKDKEKEKMIPDYKGKLKLRLVYHQLS